MGWKRRSSAGSFSMRLRYSSSVVAPMARSSPRARAGFSRLEASIEPSAAPAPDQGVQLVDEEDDLALAVDDLLDHGLQPLLELAAELRAGHEGSQVQGEKLLVLQGIRDVTRDDPPRQAFHDGGLADARLADEHGVVLRAAGEHLHDAPDLLVPADDRVELLLAGELGEVPAVVLQGLVARLGVLVGDALVAADRAQRFQRRVAGHARAPCRRSPASPPDSSMASSRCSVLVNSSFRPSASCSALLRTLESRGAMVSWAASPWTFGFLDRACRTAPASSPGVRADALQQRRDDAVLLLQQGEEEVLDVEGGVIVRVRKGVRFLQGFLRLQSQFVVSHVFSGKSFDLRYGRKSRSVKRGAAGLDSDV